MEDKKKIAILSVILTISVIVNLSSFYVIGSLDELYGDKYEELDNEWCEIVNKGNEVINLLLEEMTAYDESYKLVPRMVNMECIS